LEAVGNMSPSFFACVTEQLSIMVAAKGLLMESRSSWEGRPARGWGGRGVCVVCRVWGVGVCGM